MFLDKRLKLLYWFSRQITKAIKSLSFKLNPRKIKLISTKDLEDETGGFYDCSDEYETLVMEKLPTDASLNNRPFIIRDFFLSKM